jgi:hypothetical protein
VRIRVLYFEGCPNQVETLELVRRVALEQGITAAVEAIEVRSPEEATRLRFLGSPSVQIDGVDVDPAARQRSEFAMVCRLYGASGDLPPFTGPKLVRVRCHSVFAAAGRRAA